MDIIEGYTRVTDVLYPFSGLKNIDPDVVANAAKRGTRVHKLIDAHIKDLGIPTVDDDIKGYYESFLQLPNHAYLETPARFYCDEHKITGECDAIYMDTEGRLVLVDFKTPARESKTWMLQGSAYSYLAKKIGSFPIEKIEFIKLSKDGKAPKVYSYEEDFELYLKCLDAYRYFFDKPMEDNPLDYI